MDEYRRERIWELEGELDGRIEEHQHRRTGTHALGAVSKATNTTVVSVDTRLAFLFTMLYIGSLS